MDMITIHDDIHSKLRLSSVFEPGFKTDALEYVEGTAEMVFRNLQNDPFLLGHAIYVFTN